MIMRKFAYELTEDDTLEIHPHDWVTVLTVDRRDNAWVSNGVVHFTATNGIRYGLDRNKLLWIKV